MRVAAIIGLPVIAWRIITRSIVGRAAVIALVIIALIVVARAIIGLRQRATDDRTDGQSAERPGPIVAATVPVMVTATVTTAVTAAITAAITATVSSVLNQLRLRRLDLRDVRCCGKCHGWRNAGQRRRHGQGNDR
ncbi:hypothetical protein D9M68_776270 [compost metagenome]